jgi:hypothetical protein
VCVCVCVCLFILGTVHATRTSPLGISLSHYSAFVPCVPLSFATSLASTSLPLYLYVYHPDRQGCTFCFNSAYENLNFLNLGGNSKKRDRRYRYIHTHKHTHLHKHTHTHTHIHTNTHTHTHTYTQTHTLTHTHTHTHKHTHTHTCTRTHAVVGWGAQMRVLEAACEKVALTLSIYFKCLAHSDMRNFSIITTLNLCFYLSPLRSSGKRW